MNAFLRLLRPSQWAKNVLVFAPLLFAGELANPELALRAVAVFAIFCVLGSGAYIVNDLVDLAADRQHPLKQKRPLASGKIAPGTGKCLAAALLGLGLAAAFWIDSRFGFIGLGYLALQFLYSFVLKKIVVLDLFAVAGSLLLRVAAGGVAAGAMLSGWLLSATFLLALFLATGKRLREARLLGARARPVLEKYGEDFLQLQFTALLAMTALAYLLYCLLAAPADDFLLTAPIVLFALLRFAWLAHQPAKYDHPTDLIARDWPMLAAGAAWAATCVYLLLA